MRRKPFLLFLCLLGSLTACSNDLSENNPTFTISKKGDYYKNREYDVIYVYGFGRNEEVAKSITRFLNQSEPNTYRFYENKK